MGFTKDPTAWRRLGRALRESRERLGLSQRDLAIQAGVSTGAVQSAEAGTVPKSRMPQTLAPIARALGWPAGGVDAVLVGGEPPGGWQDVPVEMNDEELGAIVTNAMVRATSNTTSTEIRNAAEIVITELKRRGYPLKSIQHNETS